MPIHCVTLVLPLVTGDGHQRQTLTRAPADDVGQRAAQLAKAADRQIRNLPLVAPGEGGRSGGGRLPENGSSAIDNRLGNVVAAIGEVTRIGQKEVAGNNLAAIVADTARPDAQCAELRQNITGRVVAHQRALGAHSLAFTVGVVVFGVCATTSGASGAMPRVRSELAITAENTGAATSPP
jgi:hypothetical protein